MSGLPAGKYVALDRYNSPIIVTVFEHAITDRPQVMTCMFPDGTTKTVDGKKERRAILSQIQHQGAPPVPKPKKKRR